MAAITKPNKPSSKFTTYNVYTIPQPKLKISLQSATDRPKEKRNATMKTKFHKKYGKVFDPRVGLQLQFLFWWHKTFAFFIWTTFSSLTSSTVFWNRLIGGWWGGAFGKSAILYVSLSHIGNASIYNENEKEIVLFYNSWTKVANSKTCDAIDYITRSTRLVYTFVLMRFFQENYFLFIGN